MVDSCVDNTSYLRLLPGRNANAAVHDDDICRPVFEAKSNRWVQRCVSCAFLGTNKENARRSLQLQRIRVRQMKNALSTMLSTAAGNLPIMSEDSNGGPGPSAAVAPGGVVQPGECSKGNYNTGTTATASTIMSLMDMELVERLTHTMSSKTC